MYRVSTQAGSDAMTARLGISVTALPKHSVVVELIQAPSQPHAGRVWQALFRLLDRVAALAAPVLRSLMLEQVDVAPAPQASDV